MHYGEIAVLFYASSFNDNKSLILIKNVTKKICLRTYSLKPLFLCFSEKKINVVCFILILNIYRSDSKKHYLLFQERPSESER